MEKSKLFLSTVNIPLMAFMYVDLEILLHHTQFICKGLRSLYLISIKVFIIRMMKHLTHWPANPAETYWHINWLTRRSSVPLIPRGCPVPPAWTPCLGRWSLTASSASLSVNNTHSKRPCTVWWESENYLFSMWILAFSIQTEEKISYVALNLSVPTSFLPGG